MDLTIHRSQRVIYTLRRSLDRIVFRGDIWSFTANDYSYHSDGHYMDTRTASVPVEVVVPWGCRLEVLRRPLAVPPEYWVHLWVSWEPMMMACQVWQLASAGRRGFRMVGAVPDVPPSAAELGWDPEMAEHLEQASAQARRRFELMSEASRCRGGRRAGS